MNIEMNQETYTVEKLKVASTCQPLSDADPDYFSLMGPTLESTTARVTLQQVKPFQQSHYCLCICACLKKKERSTQDANHTTPPQIAKSHKTSSSQPNPIASKIGNANYSDKIKREKKGNPRFLKDMAHIASSTLSW